MFRGLKPDEIEVRVGTISEYGVTCLVYKDVRCDTNILDEVYGTDGWQRDHKEIKGNLFGGVGIWSEKLLQWIWKWDCGTESNTEKEKGEASDSFKRACFSLGIGKELYTAPHITIKVETEKRGDKYFLTTEGKKALYGIHVASIGYAETENKRTISALVIKDRNQKVIYEFGKAKPASKDTPKEVEDEIEKLKNEPISDIDAIAIRALMKSAGAKEADILHNYGIESLQEMTNGQFMNCKGLLERKKELKAIAEKETGKKKSQLE